THQGPSRGGGSELLSRTFICLIPPRKPRTRLHARFSGSCLVHSLLRRNVNPLHPDVCESGYHRHNSKAVKRVSEYAYVHKSKTEDANSRRICIIHIPPTIMSLNHSHNTQA
ncbi:hypothetical protein A4X09_0g1562, partial [Tilletia walkeri]